MSPYDPRRTSASCRKAAGPISRANFRRYDLGQGLRAGMKRRTFFGVLGAATVWPFVAHSQSVERARRVGVLTGVARNDPAASIWSSAFERALQDLGWVEGRNLRIEYRFASNDLNSTRRFAAELVALP